MRAADEEEIVLPAAAAAAAAAATCERCSVRRAVAPGAACAGGSTAAGAPGSNTGATPATTNSGAANADSNKSSSKSSNVKDHGPDATTTTPAAATTAAASGNSSSNKGAHKSGGHKNGSTTAPNCSTNSHGSTSNTLPGTTASSSTTGTSTATDAASNADNGRLAKVLVALWRSRQSLVRALSALAAGPRAAPMQQLEVAASRLHAEVAARDKTQAMLRCLEHELRPCSMGPDPPARPAAAAASSSAAAAAAAAPGSSAAAGAARPPSPPGGAAGRDALEQLLLAARLPMVHRAKELVSRVHDLNEVVAQRACEVDALSPALEPAFQDLAQRIYTFIETSTGREGPQGDAGGPGEQHAPRQGGRPETTMERIIRRRIQTLEEGGEALSEAGDVGLVDLLGACDWDAWDDGSVGAAATGAEQRISALLSSRLTALGDTSFGASLAMACAGWDPCVLPLLLPCGRWRSVSRSVCVELASCTATSIVRFWHAPRRPASPPAAPPGKPAGSGGSTGGGGAGGAAREQGEDGGERSGSGPLCRGLQQDPGLCVTTIQTLSVARPLLLLNALLPALRESVRLWLLLPWLRLSGGGTTRHLGFPHSPATAQLAGQLHAEWARLAVRLARREKLHCTAQMEVLPGAVSAVMAQIAKDDTALLGDLLRIMELLHRGTAPPGRTATASRTSSGSDCAPAAADAHDGQGGASSDGSSSSSAASSARSSRSGIEPHQSSLPAPEGSEGAKAGPGQYGSLAWASGEALAQRGGAAHGGRGGGWGGAGMSESARGRGGALGGKLGSDGAGESEAAPVEAEVEAQRTAVHALLGHACDMLRGDNPEELLSLVSSFFERMFTFGTLPLWFPERELHDAVSAAVAHKRPTDVVALMRASELLRHQDQAMAKAHEWLQRRMPVVCLDAYTTAVALSKLVPQQGEERRPWVLVPAFPEDAALQARLVARPVGQPKAAGAAGGPQGPSSSPPPAGLGGGGLQQQQQQAVECCTQLYPLGVVAHDFDVGCARGSVDLKRAPADACVAAVRQQLAEQQVAVLACSSAAEVVRGLALCAQVRRDLLEGAGGGGGQAKGPAGRAAAVWPEYGVIVKPLAQFKPLGWSDPSIAGCMQLMLVAVRAVGPAGAVTLAPRLRAQ